MRRWQREKNEEAIIDIIMGKSGAFSQHSTLVSTLVPLADRSASNRSPIPLGRRSARGLRMPGNLPVTGLGRLTSMFTACDGDECWTGVAALRLCKKQTMPR
jgi:hypothetical protein